MAAGTMRSDRPSPEAMLARARRESGTRTKGRLRVFLGAAPGVGKTYAMLSAARQAVAEGVDVVVGLVETHGRSDTEELLTGLEVLPRRQIDHGGHLLGELDLDAALARKPELLIVDELAHSNPPACRHTKRYLDVDELLEAGIDVWTTINVQHLESLSDVVARITGIVVRERVPDAVLEKADDVVVVDITPDDLIQRLKEGKVYLPDNARRAIEGFFKPSNLTALRELALRRTAEQVDDRMVSLLREGEIEGPWPSAERILVCLGTNQRSATVLRAASRLATGLGGSLVAVYLERAGEEAPDRATLERTDDLLRLARNLGAETTRLMATDLPRELLAYARRENITQIVLGRSTAGVVARLRGRSLADEVVRLSRDIAVHIVTEGAPESRPWPMLPRPAWRLSGLMTAVAAVAVTVIAGMLIRSWLILPNLSMLFLTAVLFCALTQGTVSAILAALLSFLAYNFFFIAPVYTLTIAAPQELFALLMFLIVAVLTGSLAGRVRGQAEAIRRRSARTQRLYELSRALASGAKTEDLLWTIASRTAAAIDGTVLILLAEDTNLALRASWPPEDRLTTSDWAAARWAQEHREPAGRRTATLPNAGYQFRPLVGTGPVRGVVGLAPAHGIESLSAEDERILAAMLEQSSLALERLRLTEEAARTEAAVASERLKSALLSSLSHDLRTPLSTILGAVSSLRALGPMMSEAARADLLAAIEEEATRLSRFVSNLLDMTRLEAGASDLKRGWVDVGDVLRTAIARAERSLSSRPIATSIAADLPLVRGDARLLEQVIFNILDNADKYSAAGAGVRVEAGLAGGELVIAVTDEGPGIPKEDLERVFEKFYRGVQGDGRAPGTGLGLSICRGVITAMDGSIKAESPVADEHGTRIVIRLPVPAEAEISGEAG